MKRLLTFALSAVLSFTICTAACVSTPPDMLATDGAVGRQIARVVARHDDYVLADLDIAPEAQQSYLASSKVLEALAGLPAVSRSGLRRAVEPVARVHDEYVRTDPTLDLDLQATYLASTDQLLRLAGKE